ncbi:ATP-binding protein [Calothrix sp. PCC 7507]|uniref:ATP-binding protein n=1 Tax=Calothrix sp. PCC 7507 TaxID=99598 RepID=UPI00029ECCAB|nr:ATP-binding protein [Calothrix sp. PCC 7507]AFY33161.1 multi-sensor signal transduction histidine kinase [Calothrix sp. PCC 7507]
MNINQSESTIELTNLSPPYFLFGTDIEEKSSGEQFLLSIYDSVQASIFVVDVLEDGDFCYVALNPTHERWLGIRSEDLRGKKPEDILSPVDAIRVRQHYTDCVLFGKTISYEQCLQFQGVPTWWSTTLTPLRDGNSRIYRLIGTSTKITPAKQIEQCGGFPAERERLLAELQQQIHYLQTQLQSQMQQHTAQLQQTRNFQALVRRVTEQIRDNVDETQILQTVTQELADVLQLERCQIEFYSPCHTLVTVAYESAATLPFCQGLTRQIADFPAVYPQLLQKQAVQSVEIVQAWHPKLLVVTQMACPIFDTQGMIGNFWLIRPTQEAFDEFEIDLVQQIASQCAIAIRRAKLYEITESQVRELEKIEHIKNEFLRTLSHELRTPITNISLAAQTLESVLTPDRVLDPELVPQLLQILHNECSRGSKLINDLLTLTYLEVKPDPQTLIAIDLQTWLPPIIESFRELTACQRQQLNLTIETALPPLETDITELERIFTELLSHVCKYTPAGEAITVSAHLTVDTVQISFHNSGLEIPTDQLSRIFEPFYRLSKNDPWKYSGTGLELSLVQKMVRHLGGRIHVESAAGQTTFIVEFPL